MNWGSRAGIRSLFREQCVLNCFALNAGCSSIWCVVMPSNRLPIFSNERRLHLGCCCMGSYRFANAVLQQFRLVGVSLLVLTFAWAVPVFVLGDDPSDDADGEFVVSLTPQAIEAETRLRRNHPPSCRTLRFRLAFGFGRFFPRRSFPIFLRGVKHSRFAAFERIITTGL